jgi:hypothetical protein
MNSADLVVLQELLTRTREIVARLGGLCRFETTDEGLMVEIDALHLEVGTLANQVQYHELVSWRQNQHPPRHPAPRHFRQTVPLSSDVDHGLAVPRYDVSGDRRSEASAPRELSGRWDPAGRRRRERR